MVLCRIICTKVNDYKKCPLPILLALDGGELFVKMTQLFRSLSNRDILETVDVQFVFAYY